MRNLIVVLIFTVFTSYGLFAETFDLKGECKPKEWICIFTRGEENKVEFYVQNRTPSGEYPFIIHFNFTTLNNFESDVLLPYRFISKGSSEPKKITHNQSDRRSQRTLLQLKRLCKSGG